MINYTDPTTVLNAVMVLLIASLAVPALYYWFTSNPSGTRTSHVYSHLKETGNANKIQAKG